MNNVRGTEILEELAALYSRKNTDYAHGGEQGEFGAFKRVANFMRQYPGMDWTTPNAVALMYSLKQLDAALMLMSQGRESITGEPVSARLRDVAVYNVIGVALAEEETCQKTTSPSPSPSLGTVSSEGTPSPPKSGGEFLWSLRTLKASY